MYALAGTAAACSGELEQHGSPGAIVRPRHTELTCGFPLEGNDVRAGCSPLGKADVPLTHIPVPQGHISRAVITRG